MAMEFQLTTEKAVAALKRVEASLDTLKAKLDAAGSSKGLDEISGKLGGVKGIPKDVIDSLAALSNGLGRVSAASNLNLGGIASALGSVGTGGLAAASGVTAAANASRGAGFTMQSLVAGAVRAGGSLNALSIAALGARAGLVGMVAVGVVGAIAGFAALVTRGTELTFTAQRMTAMLDNLGGKGFGAESLQFLSKVAKENAIDLQTLTKSWAQFAPQALLAGKTGAETATMFEKMTRVVKGFGVSTEQGERAFYALSQMMNKGKITAEELTQQLGDSGIPAMRALAEVMGLSPGELFKKLGEGAVSTKHLADMIDVLERQVKGGLTAAMASAEASTIRFKNSMDALAKRFSDNFWEVFKHAMNGLSEAFNMPTVLILMSALGLLAGVIGFVLVAAVLIAVGALALLGAALFLLAVGFEQILWGAILGVGTVINVLVAGVKLAIAAFAEWYNGTSMTATILRAIVDAIVVTYNAVASFVKWVYAAFASLKDLQAAAQGSTGWLQVFYLVLWVIAEAFSIVMDVIKLVIESFGWFARMVGLSAEAAMTAAEKISVLSDKFRVGSSVINQYNIAAGAATGALDIMNRTTTDVSSGTSNMSDELAKAKSGFHGMASGADTAARSLEGVASAMKAVESSGHARGPGNYYGAGSNEGSMIDKYNSTGKLFSTFTEFMADGHKEGGIVGLGSRTQVAVRRPSSFNAAPRLATGTANTSVYGTSSGGGIPIIAHPNEAVVPLGAGGSIPVSMSGGGGMSPVISMKLSELCTYSKRTIQELTIINESINQNGVLMKNESDRVVDRIDNLGVLLAGMAKSITDMGKSVTDSLSRLETAMSKANTSSNSGAGAGTGGGTNGSASGIGQAMTFGGTGFNKPFTSSKYAQVGTSTTRPGALDSVAAANAMDGSGRQAASGFALGSPNAYDEVRKGQAVNAVIHPDEAIIPLPDGRRVPVDFRGLDLNHSGDSRSTKASEVDRNSGSTINYNINMTIQTPDAASFRATQDQTLQELAVNLERVTKKIGRRQGVDDPTRRTN